jgi:hypothetical protein
MQRRAQPWLACADIYDADQLKRYASIWRVSKKMNSNHRSNKLSLGVGSLLLALFFFAQAAGSSFTIGDTDFLLDGKPNGNLPSRNTRTSSCWTWAANKPSRVCGTCPARNPLMAESRITEFI